MTESEVSRLIVPADVSGDILDLKEGLSFWGGVDPKSGIIIDAHHPCDCVSLAGKVVFLPTSRGSCSGSGVLLELALNGHAPAALVFREDEEILTLGALIAARMFGKPVAVIHLGHAAYDRLSQCETACVRATELCTDAEKIDLQLIAQSDLALTPADRNKLQGGQGPAVALAMEVICAMAAIQGAERLIDVTRGHIDGCIYSHSANLIFAEAMEEMGARVAVPTTINAISVDRENWREQKVPAKFGQAASRLADAYVRMGARPTFTCAPYFEEDMPLAGECIGWSESNAVIFANSVLGARTAKHPDYFDLFVALTGRAPQAGVYLCEHRRATLAIDVERPAVVDDAFWPLLGWVAGQKAPRDIPFLTGLEGANPSQDDLRALCAAFGTTSAAPMLHIAGVTPGNDMNCSADLPRTRITLTDLAGAWDSFNHGEKKVDLVALGSPHFSLEETRHFARLMAGKTVAISTDVIVTMSRATLARARAEGLAGSLEASGVQLLVDLCWCSIVDPVFPPQARTVMTNSAKYAHYAPGLSGRQVRFGSLADCALAAQTGNGAFALPLWLQQA